MWVRLNCFLRRRHHYRLRISKGRMYMQCADCGYRSQGWEMGPKARPLTPHTPRPSALRLTLDRCASGGGCRGLDRAAHAAPAV